MNNKSLFRRKYLLGLLTSPVTLYPVVGGVTGLAAGAIGIWVPEIFAVGALSTLFGIGAFLQRLVTGCEPIARRAMEEAELESLAVRNRALDALDESLQADNDPRTERCLRNLRALSDAFNKDDTWRAGVNAYVASEMVSIVNTAFGRCVAILRSTLGLYQSAQKAATKDVQQAIGLKREKLIQAVLGTVSQLAQTLAGLHALSTSHDQGAELSQLGQELAHQLEVMRDLDERIKTLQFGGASEPDDFKEGG